MNSLEVNTYINAAMEALNDDPEYNRWFNALVEQRKAAMQSGYDLKRLEGILFEIWNMRIGYILEHQDEIKSADFDIDI